VNFDALNFIAIGYSTKAMFSIRTLSFHLCISMR
jgi:hypothetical protein